MSFWKKVKWDGKQPHAFLKIQNLCHLHNLGRNYNFCVVFMYTHTHSVFMWFISFPFPVLEDCDKIVSTFALLEGVHKILSLDVNSSSKRGGIPMWLFECWMHLFVNIAQESYSSLRGELCENFYFWKEHS